mmetsp:Transcript_109977/g.342896  ORF Transcript_109977/g.342896 Transcript_109977/m.342896 type:complete len:351 (-) Transcript_109977:88-1140(-)
MGSDKKKRSDRSRSRRGDAKKRRRSPSQTRDKSSSPSKKRKESSKTKKRRSNSRHRSNSKKKEDSKRRSRSKKRSSSGRRSKSGSGGRRRRRSPSRRKSSSRKRRSSSRKGDRSKDGGKEKKGRSKSRRKSVSRSDSEDSRSHAISRRRPRNSGFDQREPVPESQLSEAQMVVPVMGPPPKEPNPEVEAFLAMNPVEPHAANQLRGLPPHLQRVVLARGSLMSARDRSAVLTSRISDALTGSSGAPRASGCGLGIPAAAPMLPMSVHPGIEALIAGYNLDARCAAMLRMLPPDKQARAAELPVHEARNPSAFVMAQIQLLFGWRSGLAPTPTPPSPMQPAGGTNAIHEAS